MLLTDIKNRTIIVTQKLTSLKRITKITGVEPLTSTGKVRLRSGRKIYGLLYNSGRIKELAGRSKIRDGKGKYWKIIIKAHGESPFLTKGSKVSKRRYMGGVKHYPCKHKFQGANRMNWGDLTLTQKRKK